MSIPAVGAPSTSWNTHATSQRAPAPPALTNIATPLGVSAGELNGDLHAGTSLSSLAAQKGISTGELVASIESDLKAGAPGMPAPVLTQLATTIASGAAPGGPHSAAPTGRAHHHGGGHSAHGGRSDGANKGGLLEQLKETEEAEAKTQRLSGYDSAGDKTPGGASSRSGSAFDHYA
jgi:hypothetical protein